MIHEEICTYEVCKLAKEKGFNVQTFDWYDYMGNYHKGFIPHELHECPRYKEYYAPTQSLLQRWLREEKGYYVYPYYDNNEFKWTYSIRENTGDMWILLVGETPNFDKYEEAMEAGLKFVLENLV